MSQLSRAEIIDRAAAGESLRGVNLMRADLSGLDIPRIDLTEANLRMADLSRANLRESRLTGCSLSGATLEHANLMGSNLVEASLIGVTLRAADLSRADLSGADLTGANLEGAQLLGAYLVGTYLNETDLRGANLSAAYMRMGQLSGSNLKGALLEAADLSNADLPSVRLDEGCLIAANLAGANLSASSLMGCDLRGADLRGADLRGCNLTGARLHGVKFDGVRLDDAWAEWVDIGADDAEDERAPLEEFFAGLLGKPTAQILIEGVVGDDVWAVILGHLSAFHLAHPEYSHLRLKTIQQGTTSAALYLEAENEISLVAYLSEFADIMGQGSVELFEQLATAVAERPDTLAGVLSAGQPVLRRGAGDYLVLGDSAAWVAESLQQSSLWTSEKAIVILTGDRRIWMQASSSKTLTIRPPHGFTAGIPVVRGRFVTEESRRTQAPVDSPVPR
ncbi:MAG TPA: pentapeptide repeat-containing protein [Blastocatellia bacterium]|nr:pentapeptide repeat-containing protein [Blastocatellia bacterium]